MTCKLRYQPLPDDKGEEVENLSSQATTRLASKPQRQTWEEQRISPPTSCRQQSGVPHPNPSSIAVSVLAQRISQTLVTAEQTPARCTHMHLKTKLILPAHTSHVHTLALDLRKNSDKKRDPSQGSDQCSKRHLY